MPLMIMEREPLMMLKDLLLLDSSSSDYHTQVPVNGGPSPRPMSNNISSLKKLRLTISKILKKSFSITSCTTSSRWKEITDAEAPLDRRTVKVRDIIRFGSFLDRHPFPSPTISTSGTSSSWATSDFSDFVADGSPPASLGFSDASPPATPNPRVGSKEATKEQDQLSPISVIDFPYHRYQEQSKSPDYAHQMNENEKREREREMLKKLESEIKGLIERVGGERNYSCNGSMVGDDKEVAEWMRGRRWTTEEDGYGDMCIEEMESCGRRWTRFDDGVRTVAAEVEDVVLVSLVEEIVLHLHQRGE